MERDKPISAERLTSDTAAEMQTDLLQPAAPAEETGTRTEWPKAVVCKELLGLAWDILKARGPMRGSDLGWELWGETTEVPSRGTGSHQHNKFCRPAGKLLKRLQRLGCVREIPAETCMTWTAMGNRPNAALCEVSKICTKS